MRPIGAWTGTATFLVAAPGVVAGLLPWAITRWRVAHALPWPLRVSGAALIAAAAAVLLPAFWRFAAEGGGTPAPIAPTERLVVGGLYARVRNPMYLAVTAAIGGQALLLGSPALAAYGAAALAAMIAFVRGYEEPALARRYGAAYEEYRRAVPGWWPWWPATRPCGATPRAPPSATPPARGGTTTRRSGPPPAPAGTGRAPSARPPR